jgi:phage-related protein
VGGRPKAKEEFEKLPKDGQAGLAALIERYLSGETRVSNNHFRVIFMHWGPDCVALTAFYKNQRQTPKKDLDRARTRASRWRVVYGKAPIE